MKGAGSRFPEAFARWHRTVDDERLQMRSAALPNAVVVVLLAAAVVDVLLAFECGTDPIQNALSEMVIKIDCPARLDAFNNCCAAHDKCYAAKAGRDRCDNIFCACTKQAGDANVQCQAHGRNFCNMVRSFGALAYTTGR